MTAGGELWEQTQGGAAGSKGNPAECGARKATGAWGVRLRQ